MLMKHVQFVAMNPASPPSAKLMASLVLLALAIGELLTGLAYIAAIVLGAYAVVLGVFWREPVPPLLLSLLVGLLAIIVFTERLWAWAVAANAKAKGINEAAKVPS